LTDPFAITSATSNAMTTNTAAPAAIHNQRGDFGPCGGGAAPGISPGGGPGWSCCQYCGGNCLVGFVSFGFGAHWGTYPP
jgi:hypothetical protein